MQTGRRAYPLRQVVGWGQNEYGVMVETLECGHQQNRLSDVFGPTNAYRRRCARCARATDTPVPAAEAGQEASE